MATHTGTHTRQVGLIVFRMSPTEKFDKIRPSILRVQATWDGGGWFGTAFVVGRRRESNRLIVATAKHLLVRLPKDQLVTWVVHQFGEVGNDIERQIVFKTHATKTSDVPYRTHNDSDVGLLQLPAQDGSGTPFARDGEKPLRTIEPRYGVDTGTRIAWSGFPKEVQDYLGHPQLCCFESVVSAMVHGEGRRKVYVVPGQASIGATGGPVWQWSAEQERTEVVGVIPRSRSRPGLPGYLFVEPINPIMYYLEEWRAQDRSDFIITACRD